MNIRKVLFQITIWHFGNFSFQNFIVQENVFSESDYFFRKISFQTLIFNEKVCVKNTPFKMGTKSGKFVVFCGANWVKTTFLDVNFSSQPDFSKIKELKPCFSENNFLPKFDYSKSFFFEVCRNEKLTIQNLPGRKILKSKSQFVEKKCFRIRCFISKKFISNSDFQWKVLLQNHAI